MNSASVPVTIAIPTYRREQVLLDTLRALIQLEPAAAEILVLDQTERHVDSTLAELAALEADGRIRWLKLVEPSIPKAMNGGLREASQPVVMFLDDDIRPDAGLVAAHWSAHQTMGDVLIAGKVLQPWDEGRDYPAGMPFHFASSEPHWIEQFMGGNFSMRRDSALSLGGFDENFVRVAYRFEAEFAHRVLASGRRIRFEPAAIIHHLKIQSGGTRTYGEHLTTWRPDHAVGAYYYALRTGNWAEFFGRPWRSIVTRYHLTHPWQIPVTLVAEARGIAWALILFCRGPRLPGQGHKRNP